MPCKIANYKVSCKCDAFPLDNVLTELKKQNICYRVYNNFVVFEKVFTYIIFKQGRNGKNHINITKIKSRDGIQDAVAVLELMLKCHFSDLKIDSITASSSIDSVIDLYQISAKKTWGVLKYNSQKFPGLFIKHSLGTVIIFHSGKIVILGCKTETDIEWLASQVIALTSTE